MSRDTLGSCSGWSNHCFNLLVRVLFSAFLCRFVCTFLSLVYVHPAGYQGFRNSVPEVYYRSRDLCGFTVSLPWSSIPDVQWLDWDLPPLIFDDRNWPSHISHSGYATCHQAPCWQPLPTYREAPTHQWPRSTHMVRGPHPSRRPQQPRHATPHFID